MSGQQYEQRSAQAPGRLGQETAEAEGGPPMEERAQVYGGSEDAPTPHINVDPVQQNVAYVYPAGEAPGEGAGVARTAPEAGMEGRGEAEVLVGPGLGQPGAGGMPKSSGAGSGRGYDRGAVGYDTREGALRRGGPAAILHLHRDTMKWLETFMNGDGRVMEPGTVRHPDGIPNNKTGTTFTATLHIFCAVVGAGVLALPKVLAWLGWVAGPICIIAFYIIALVSSRMLSAVYCVNDTEHARYHHAATYILGRGASVGVSICQIVNLFLFTLAYTITAGVSMRNIANQACKINGTAEEDCFNSTWAMTLIFSSCQLILSQVPNLEAAWWVSGLGALTSLFYCGVAMVLGLIYSGNRLGTVGGIPADPVNKAFGILNALGGVAFAYTFSLILVEIQDTIRQPPSAVTVMKKACNYAITASFVAYFVVAVGGYAALGNDAPGMVLEGFPEAPQGILIAANVAILVHMLSAFQTYGQPMYDTLESWIKMGMVRRARKIKRKNSGSQGSISDNMSDVEKAEMKTLSVDGIDAAREAQVHNTAPHPAAPPSAAHLVHPDGKIAHKVQELAHNAAMFHVDTGAANEDVPSNDDFFLLPLWMRLVTRSAYVGLICILAIIMPFFGDMCSLIGALTFFPLAIWYPFRMYHRVYKPTGWRLWSMVVVAFVMFLICIGSTLGAVRGIINNWSTYEFFAN